jgi:hypothetical protein
LLIAVLAVVALGVGGAVVLTSGDSKPDPDETLTAAQEATADATSFRFTLDVEDVSSVGNEDAGSTTTTHYTGEGEWADDRWHQLFRGGDFSEGASETVVDGSKEYDRWADDTDALQDELWQEWDYEQMSQTDMLDELKAMSDAGDDLDMDGFDDMMAVGLATELFMGGQSLPGGGYASGDTFTGSTGFVGGPGFASDPTGFLDAIDQISEPTLEAEQDGVTTLAATVTAPDEFVDAFGSPIPDGKVELDVGADDLPTALRFSATQADSSLSIEVRFTDWNGSIDIAVPSEDEIDATPWLDEESLRAATIPLVWLSAPPDGWELTVYSPDEDYGTTFGDSEGECENVELDWDEPYPEDVDPENVDYEDTSYIWITLTSVECSLSEDPTPFAPGGPAGLPSRTDDYGMVQVQVGDTAVLIDTTLSDEELAPILATLTPVDVETVIEAASSGY